MKRKSQTFNGSIEQEINSIHNSLVATLEKGLVAEKVKLAKVFSACKGIISIYRKADLQRFKADPECKPTAVESYAFFADTYRPSKIRSVAVYGANAYNSQYILMKRGFLFGHKILSAKIEYGRRPFVDVTLAI